MLPSVLLEQVLANLVLNAARADATTVWFSALHKDGGVRIPGAGWPEALAKTQLYQAFQPF